MPKVYSQSSMPWSDHHGEGVLHLQALVSLASGFDADVSSVMAVGHLEGVVSGVLEQAMAVRGSHERQQQ